MKKSLLTLAVLGAFAGVAQAQSTVTLYGVADAWVGSDRSQTLGIKQAATATTPAVLGLVGERQIRQNSGGRNGSRWGLRGVEDLGGGLKGNFVLESGFTIDDGNVANGATMFGRQAYVGVSGGFGEIRLGRQYTAYDELRAGNNTVGDTAFSPTGDVWGQGAAPSVLTGDVLRASLIAAGLTTAQANAAVSQAAAEAALLPADYSNRVNNQIYYATPNISGLTASIGFALGENKVPGASATNVLSAKVQYAAGPFMIGFAHQNQKVRTTAGVLNSFAGVAPPLNPNAAANSPSTKFNLISGSFNFGVAKLIAAYQQVDRTDGIDDKEFKVGLDVPLGSALVARLGYAQAKGYDDTVKSKGFGGILDYSLSKRTNAYFGLRMTESKAEGVKFSKNEVVAVGLRHAF